VTPAFFPGSGAPVSDVPGPALQGVDSSRFNIVSIAARR